jgi:hypothetical protein
MARTLTVKSGGSAIKQGWHEATIKKAEYGEYNDSKYIDVWFHEFPENLNMRVYETTDSKGNEFAVGSVFRFANAGITQVLDGPNGEKSVTIDDNPNLLRDRKLNVYLYPDPKNPKYNRVLKQPAPTVFENDVESFTETDVKFWMEKAESYFIKYVKQTAPGTGSTTTVNLNNSANMAQPTDTADLPF